MAKYSGKIGFAHITGDDESVYTENYVERKVYGELIRNNRRLTGNDKINPDIAITNRITVVADPYSLQNYMRIRYATFRGVKWKVEDVEVAYPRLILSLGGQYHA